MAWPERLTPGGVWPERTGCDRFDDPGGGGRRRTCRRRRGFGCRGGGRDEEGVVTSLEVEMTDHLGYDRHAVEGSNRGNSRNRTRAKTGSGRQAASVGTCRPAPPTAALGT